MTPPPGDAVRYRIAQAEQERELLREGPVVPWRITTALDARGLDGPEVDRALGGEEPMVDMWEAGDLVPTRAEIDALAKLTGYAAWFFHLPPGEREGGYAWFCTRGGRDRGCERVWIGPPQHLAEVIPLPGASRTEPEQGAL